MPYVNVKVAGKLNREQKEKTRGNGGIIGWVFFQVCLQKK